MSDLYSTRGNDRAYMGGEFDREDGGVNNANVGCAVDDKFGVNNTSLFKRKHGTGCRRVEFGPDVVREPGVPVVISRHRRARDGLASQLFTERSSRGKLANEFGTSTKDVEIYSGR